jgi:hypothetical protein
MNEVKHNFKVTPHVDGKGCDVEIPVSADFFREDNARLLGYGHEKDGHVTGPIKHASTLRSKFESEDDIYNVVEKYALSFGPLKVKKRVIDPKVKTKNIYCATFVFYFEIDEEKASRKQKITLDDDEDTNPANAYPPLHLLHLNMALSLPLLLQQLQGRQIQQQLPRRHPFFHLRMQHILHLHHLLVLKITMPHSHQRISTQTFHIFQQQDITITPATMPITSMQQHQQQITSPELLLLFHQQHHMVSPLTPV